MEELQAQLIEEYSQLMDTSTILAILYDYNISNATGLAAARETLDILTSSASAEESTGFDPSGASGPEHALEEQGSVRESESPSTSQRESKTQTDDTSLSQDSRILDLEGLDLGGEERGEISGITYSSELDTLELAGKEHALISIFPALKPFDIKWTLKKCKGDAGLAIDELMTQAFLEESGTRQRGVDAFSENEAAPRRKGKGKRKRGQAKNASNPTTPPSPVESPVESKWKTGKEDIDFVSEKTDMPVKQVTTIYHKNGGTARSTIAAIIKAHAETISYGDDPVFQLNAYQLHQDFPSISVADLEILLHITNPSQSDARDLARALATPLSINKKNAIQLDILHAPLQLDEPTPKPKPFNAVYPSGPHDYTNSFETSARLAQARNTAFAQATAAHRKAKSNPLFGGAAAHYSSVGRDFNVRAKAAASQAADALVASQSSRLELDLHGMNVKDSLRISRERVTMWWHAYGEERADGRSAKVPHYKIVTGAGNHSSGGGKLGPAVAKMLLAEGWKIQIGSGSNMGYLLVLGVVRRR